MNTLAYLRPVLPASVVFPLLLTLGCEPGECDAAAQPAEELSRALRGDDYDQIARNSEQLIAALDGTTNDELSLFKTTTEDLLAATEKLKQPADDPAQMELDVGAFDRRQEGWTMAYRQSYAQACK